jgi:hypothetical protein
VGLRNAIKIEGQKIRFRYAATPLGAVTVQNLRTVVFFPYKDWSNAPFRAGALAGTTPRSTYRLHVHVGEHVVERRPASEQPVSSLR